MKKQWQMVLAALLLATGSLYAGKGKIRVAADQEGAYIYVDGKKKAMTGEGFTSILLDEGEHLIKVVKPLSGNIYEKSAEKKVYVGEDTSIKVSLELSKKLTKKGELDRIEFNKGYSQNRKYHENKYERKNNIVIDKLNKIMWQDDKTRSQDIGYSYEQAVEYCKNLSLSGYSNWRLPSYYELMDIIDYYRYEPSIVNIFQNVYINSYYWSLNPIKTNYNKKWTVGYRNGKTTWWNIKNDDGSDRYLLVRCVKDIK